jgi:hypothetical protein
VTPSIFSPTNSAAARAPDTAWSTTEPATRFTRATVLRVFFAAPVVSAFAALFALRVLPFFAAERPLLAAPFDPPFEPPFEAPFADPRLPALVPPEAGRAAMRGTSARAGAAFVALVPFAPLPDAGRLADARFVDERFAAPPDLAAPFAPPEDFFAAPPLADPRDDVEERAPVVPADDPRVDARVVLPFEDFVPSAMRSSL